MSAQILVIIGKLNRYVYNLNGIRQLFYIYTRNGAVATLLYVKWKWQDVHKKGRRSGVVHLIHTSRTIYVIIYNRWSITIILSKYP